MKFTVSLPFSGLSPNNVRSKHWRSAQSARKKYWKVLDGEFLEQGVPSVIQTPIVIDYEFFTARLRMPSGGKRKVVPDGLYRPQDEDNAKGSMKSFQDYLVVTGRIRDDRAKTVRIGRVKVWTDKESCGKKGVVVTIRRPGVGK